ncbi:stalk domain-containing protein [Cohnella sp. GCM10020058]|uniref:stalk domain-containing protein n=1 Tax=Cohnella sp. GCM10020058 TaxID=3317330 RepID=UPI003634FBAD
MKIARLRLSTATAVALLLAVQPISAMSANPTAALSLSTSSLNVSDRLATLQLQTVQLGQVLMVPARSFFQNVGASFQLQKNVFSAKLEGRSITGTIGSPNAFINGTTAKLEYSPKLINGTLYIPAKLAIGVMEYDVWSYDDKSKRFTFSYSRQKLNKLAYDAVMQGDAVKLQKLLDIGFDINAKINGSSEWTVLDYAIQQHRPLLAELLLKRGGTYKQAQVVPLLYPSDKQATETLEVLLKNGLDANSKVFDSPYTLLEQAFNNYPININAPSPRPTVMPSYDTVSLLLKFGAEVSSDVFYRAAGAADYDTIQELLRHGGNPDLLWLNSVTPRKAARDRGVEGWLVRDAAQTLSRLAIETAEGNPVWEGNVKLSPFYTSKGSPVSVRFVQYAYFDSANYQPESVLVNGKAWFLDRQPIIKIGEAAAAPSRLTLPPLNVKARVMASDPANYNGILVMRNTVNGQKMGFKPRQGEFELYLPPGKYAMSTAEPVAPGQSTSVKSSAEVIFEIKEDTASYEVSVPVPVT